MIINTFTLMIVPEQIFKGSSESGKIPTNNESSKNRKGKQDRKKKPNNAEVKEFIGDRMKNFFSQLLEDTLDDEERKNNPELIRVRNNILILLLIFSAYGVYYLIGDFIDILLIAYIAGLGYQQMRERFTQIITHESSYEGESSSLGVRIIKACALGTIGFMLPRLQYMLSYPERIHSFPSFSDYIGSIKKNDGTVVAACQMCIILYIIYILLGTHLKKVGKKLRPTNIKLVRFIFAILIITFTLIAFIAIPSVMFRELSSVGYTVQTKIEEKLGCQILGFEEVTANSTVLPFCSDKITTENEFIKQTIAQFRDQNQTIERCMDFIDQMQMEYIGERVFDYDEIACTWYSFFEKASNYSGISTGKQGFSSMVFTGTNIFKTFFGNIALVLSGFSNLIFSSTTFVTMFMLTVQYNENQSSTIREIFSQNKQLLISSITNLIQATFFIVIEHFFVSIVLLEIFGFTGINLLISTLLSSMAFFPFFRPWFGILLVGLARILILGEYYISLSFVVLYYIVSQKIYSFHYRKMEIHEIITNMSVLFGIYRFGIAGIFYGPLIIILYKFVEKELLLKQLNSRK